MTDHVVLVDERDRETGTAPKLDAHRSGALHRAFSVMVFDRRHRVLLQRRARSKYHSGGLWANTCCGHPRPGESVVEAASRRLTEEMGIAVALRPVGAFTYRARLGDLEEHEYDHVLVGRYDGEPRPAPAEVEDWRWVDPAAAAAELAAFPERFAVWFGQVLALARSAGG
jgi:isopentenyl-diphosphate delta-isomerase